MREKKRNDAPKTAAERQAARQARLAKAGYVLVQAWVPAAARGRALRYLDRLRRPR